MICKASVLFVAVVALLLPDVVSAQSSNVATEVRQRAATGRVRVIVRLALATRSESELTAYDVQLQRAAIASAQDAALDALPRGGEAVTRFETLAAFAVTTDQAGLARLAEMPLVIDVYEDRLLTPVGVPSAAEMPVAADVGEDGLATAALGVTAPLVRADRLWANGSNAFLWNVAILDSGVEKAHTFFQGRTTSEACYSTTVPSLNATSLCPRGVSATVDVNSGVNCAGIPDCDNGTRVAGIAVGQNNIFSGIARRAGLISIQIFSRFEGLDACGTGNPGPCILAFSSDVTLALERVRQLANAGHLIGAVSLNARGELMDAPCDAIDPVFVAAVNNLRAIGIPTIVASGDSQSRTQLPPPACFSNVISVASSSKTDAFSGFSNRTAQLALVAPGEHIQTSNVNDTYGIFTNTSMAEAHVAGGWTLLKSIYPTAPVNTVLDALQRTGVRLFDSGTGLSFPRIVLDKAAGSMGPAGSPTEVIATAIDQTVTVTWANPFDGSLPAAFHVEFSQWDNPANVLAVVNTGNARSYVATAPAGRYLVRVRSISAAGVRGAASNDVPLLVGAPPITEPPLAPRDLRAVVDGQTVTFYWNLPLESAPATNYSIDVGSITGLTNFGTFDTNSSETTAVIRNANPGTYFVRVRARNVFGSSLGSNEVTVNITGTGCVSVPPPTGFTATVIGSHVTLSWNPHTYAGAVSGYVIDAGTAPGLSNVVSATIGNQTVIAANVASGVYYVRVRAQTVACGLTGPSSEVTVVVP